MPEGVEGQIPYKGPVAGVIHQLIGGLRASMGYTGNESIPAMHCGCEFRRVSWAGLSESHAHGIVVTHDAPNYPNRG